MDIKKEHLELLLGIKGTADEQAEAYRAFFSKYPEKARSLLNKLNSLPEDNLTSKSHAENKDLDTK